MVYADRYGGRMRMTKAMEKEITEIKVSIGRIEEHLKAMNGSMIDYKRHMNEVCPTKHKEINKFMYKVLGGIAVLITVANFLAAYIIKNLG